jgi:formylglycine-generating enzyme required for sulfatase activity
MRRFFMFRKTIRFLFALLIFIPIFVIPNMVSASDYEDMVLIPAGEFEMGGNGGDPDERPRHTVYIDAFFIDKFEVTNTDFAVFLNDEGNKEVDGASWIFIDSDYCMIKKTDSRFTPVEGFEDHPVVMVSYYGALAYCEWAKKRLPTEAEWERAARGGVSDAIYPWGNDIDTTRVNYERKKRGTTPVGVYPPNGYGLFDMAGNVSEMVSDFYSDNYYRISPGKNPGGPEIGEFHTVRGGSWLSGPKGLRVSKRREGILPYLSLPDVGFRCVKDAD